MFLFDLVAPRSARAGARSPSESEISGHRMRFSPDGTWLASEYGSTAILWNTAGPHSMVLGRQEPPHVGVTFTRDGYLISTSDAGVLRRWPLLFRGGEEVRETRVCGARPAV